MSDLACTICGEKNLDYDSCFNCKGMKECINCCGCLGEVSCGACGQLTGDLDSHLEECDLNPINERGGE